MKVFVIGGVGYIGSYMCKVFVEVGYEFVVYDNLLIGYCDVVCWGLFVVVDIFDCDVLLYVFVVYWFDVVIYFVVFVYVGELVFVFECYYMVNVMGICMLLSVMCVVGVGRIVMLLLCVMYGILEVLLILECMLQWLINLYGFMKYVMEWMVVDFECVYGLKWIVLCYFNVVGVDFDGVIGECYVLEMYVLLLVICVVLCIGDVFWVMGIDYLMLDGLVICDYVYVSDFVDVYLKVSVYLCGGGLSVVLNFGIGNGMLVFVVLCVVEVVMGCCVLMVLVVCCLGDLFVLYVDVMMVVWVFGWWFCFIVIELMVEYVVVWFQKEW